MKHLGLKHLGLVALVGSLMALLIASVWWAANLWMAVETEALPAGLYVALAGGVLFSLLVGCGLMALVFYSSRRGYDDGVHGAPSSDDGASRLPPS